MKNYDYYQGQKNYQHGSTAKLGILLTNLGTPDEPTARGLKPYLKQFLSDPRVIELPRWKWLPILNLIVLKTRPAKVAEGYKEIWTDEGSPLLVITNRQAEKLESRLKSKIGNPLVVEVGMRYGNPSIESALQNLKEAGADKILIIPMYAQNSSATVGSTFDCVADELKKWRCVPSIRTIMQFHDEPGYIRSLVNSIKTSWQENGRREKLVMSFHGIPKRYFLNGDPYPCHCRKTARLVAEGLGLKEDEYLITFQSLFGKEEWVRPYTDETLISLAKGGLKSVEVICPGFLADCLETIEEIEVENKDNFLGAGGEDFHYIPALNDRDDFMDALADLALENLSAWYQPVESWSEQEASLEAERSLEQYEKYRARN